MSASIYPEGVDHGAGPTGEEANSQRARPWRPVVVLLLVIGLTGLGVRFGARTEAGRSLIVRLIDGLDLGAVGRLRIAGLEGDPFAAFSVKSVRLQDQKGVWLEAEGVSADWRPLQLLVRTAHVVHLSARRITVRRRPELVFRPPGPPSKPVVSVAVDAVDAELRTDAAFSVQPGDWRLAGRGRLNRGGVISADLHASSLRHAGDGVTLRMNIDPKGSLSLQAGATESGGGALAGALGLSTDAPLAATLAAQGRLTDAGPAPAQRAFGSASARISSGSAQVLDGAVRWSGGTLLAQGRLDLGRSSVTRSAAARLGGPVLLRLKSVHAFKRTPDIDLQLVSPQARLAAQGPVDWSLRRTSGLSLTVAVADLAAWLPQPRVGAASFKGKLLGASDRFTLRGLFEGRDFSEPGYRASSLTGPLDVALERAQWRIAGALRAGGGGGGGLMAALVGTIPLANFDLLISKDGRLLVRSLDLKGRSVSFSGAGGQPPGGGLTFKGRLTLNDLALARPGAAGAAAVSLEATQSPRSAAWRIALTAAAGRFSAGSKDIDLLIGPDPRLQADIIWSSGAGLELLKSSLQGRAGELEAQGRIDSTRRANLALSWTVKGPLAVGPLEIDGAVKGTGRVIGLLEAPQLDLDAETPRFAVGSLLMAPARLTLALQGGGGALSGRAALTGPTATYGPASLTADFHTQGETLNLDRLNAEGGGVRISGSAAWAHSQVLSADLKAHAAAGAFLLGGGADATLRLQGAGRDQSAAFDLSGSDLRIAGAPPLQSLKVRGSGPLAALPFSVEMTSATPTPVSFLGRGLFSRLPVAAEVTLEGSGRINKADYRLLEPAHAVLGPDRRSLTARLAVGGGEADVNLRQAPNTVELVAAVKTVSIAAFNPEFQGVISGTARLSGQGAALSGVSAATLDNARSRDAPAQEALKADIAARLDGGKLRLEAKAVNAEGFRSSGTLEADMKTSAAPFVLATEPDKPLRGSFSADGEIRPLWDLLSGGERALTGKVSTSGSISGTLARPIVAGEAVLSGGRFKDGGTGLSLQSLQVQSAFDDDGLTVRQFSAVDAKSGSISGEGRVSFSDNGASTFTLAVKRFQLLDNDLGRAVASGSIVVTHPARGQGKLSGALTIDRADIVAAAPTPTGVVPMEVEEIHQPPRSGAVKPATTAIGPPILLDVAIRAPRGIYVKGKGLNVELSLDARVTGSLAHPDLGGSAKVVAGSYDFAGKRFDVGTAGSIKLASSPQQIRLDLTATWEDPTLNAVVKVSGTAAKPEIALTSIPVLPQDEVLARVLFGVSASQLSGAQAAELGSALASLAGGGGFDVIGNLRQFAGLDRLALGSTQNATTTVSGGKYINKDVYLELTGGARNGSGASVEWRIRKNLSLISRYGAALDPRYPNDTDASLSIRFRRDF